MRIIQSCLMLCFLFISSLYAQTFSATEITRVAIPYSGKLSHSSPLDVYVSEFDPSVSGGKSTLVWQLGSPPRRLLDQNFQALGLSADVVLSNFNGATSVVTNLYRAPFSGPAQAILEPVGVPAGGFHAISTIGGPASFPVIGGVYIDFSGGSQNFATLWVPGFTNAIDMNRLIQFPVNYGQSRVVTGVYDVNTSFVAVGESRSATPPYQDYKTVVFDMLRGIVFDLPLPVGTGDTLGVDINGLGDVVGSVLLTGNGYWVPVMWHRSGFLSYLPLPSFAVGGHAFEIDDFGTIVGRVVDVNAASFPIIWNGASGQFSIIGAGNTSGIDPSCSDGVILGANNFGSYLLQMSCGWNQGQMDATLYLVR